MDRLSLIKALQVGQTALELIDKLDTRDWRYASELKLLFEDSARGCFNNSTWINLQVKWGHVKKPEKLAFNIYLASRAILDIMSIKSNESWKNKCISNLIKDLKLTCNKLIIELNKLNESKNG